MRRTVVDFECWQPKELAGSGLQNHLNISGQASDSYSELVGIQKRGNSKGWNVDMQSLEKGNWERGEGE